MSNTAKPLKRRRVRVQVTMDADLHDELKAYAAVVPGASISGMINDFLVPMIPDFKSVRTAISSGDNEALRGALEKMVGASIMRAQYTMQREREEKESKKE